MKMQKPDARETGVAEHLTMCSESRERKLTAGTWQCIRPGQPEIK